MREEILVTVPAFPSGMRILGTKGMQQRRGFRAKFSLRFRTFLEVAGTLEPQGIPDVPGRYLLRKGRFPRNHPGGTLRSGVVGKKRRGRS